MTEPPATEALSPTGQPPAVGWRARLTRFFDSGHDFGDDERALSYKHRFINTVFFVTGILVTGFGLWRLAIGQTFIGSIDIAFGITVFVLMLSLRRVEKTRVDSYATLILTLCLVLFTTVYILIVDAVRSGPFLLITACAFFLKGRRIGIRWSIVCMVTMVLVELLPAPYAKGIYGTLTSILDIVALILLLSLYEHQKQQDSEALARNEEKFRTIFNSSNDAIFLIEDGRFSQWNAAALATFRCPDDCFEDRRLHDLLATDNPPELREALHAAENRALDTRSAALELLLRRYDGSEFFANLRLTPVTISGKRMIQAIIRDIDTRKRTEVELAGYREELEQRVRERTQRLEESELRFSRLLELTEEGIFIHENGIIIDVTNAFCRLTGYVKHELIGRDFLVLLVPPEARPTVQEYIAAAGTHKYELTVVRADGQRIDVESFGRAVAVGGRPLRAGVWRDVTARKETERNLERARQTAEQATRAKSAFIANMSHEIRTPLNAIIGITHQLQRDSSDQGQRERLARVDGAAHHLLMILSDILDISKIEAGKLTLEHRPFSFRQLIDRVSDLVRDNAAHKGLDFRVLTDERLPQVVVGDAMRLSQVLLNLASNSVKFTESGNVTLWISVITGGPGTATLRFRISDTGIGMTAEQCSRLFRDFEQAESSTTRRYGGTGLGLSISRRLVELMGGQIQVRSEPGAGSDFWFELTLPISTAALAEIERSAEKTTAAQVRSRHSGARILLVEDTPINQEVALDLLDEAGLDASIAENGRIAVERVRDETFDLVLMDLQMPIMDGLSATREIRALPGCAHLPIIAMTANAYAEDRAQCLQAGMNDYLAKPIEAPVLFAALDRWLPETVPVAGELPTTPEETLPLPETEAAADAPVSDASVDAIARLSAEHGFAGITEVTLAQYKPERYIRLLKQLFAEHGEDGSLILALLDRETEDAAQEASRIAHTLKGVAATFGLTELARLAGQLNHGMIAGDERVQLAAEAEAVQAMLNHLATTAARVING